MKPAEYLQLREMLGSQDDAAKALDVTTTTISRRERGLQRLTREAAYAILYAVELEKATPSPKVTRPKQKYGRKR